MTRLTFVGTPQAEGAGTAHERAGQLIGTLQNGLTVWMKIEGVKIGLVQVLNEFSGWIKKEAAKQTSEGFGILQHPEAGDDLRVLKSLMVAWFTSDSIRQKRQKAKGEDFYATLAMAVNLYLIDTTQKRMDASTATTWQQEENARLKQWFEEFREEIMNSGPPEGVKPDLWKKIQSFISDWGFAAGKWALMGTGAGAMAANALSPAGWLLLASYGVHRLDLELKRRKDAA